MLGNLGILFFLLAAWPLAVQADLLEQAKRHDPAATQKFLSRGGKIVPTSDGKSFYLFWSPRPDAPIIVTLHGHGSYAFNDFSAWESTLSRKNYGMLAPQWWFGSGESPNDYYFPRQLVKVLREAVEKEKLTTRRLILHGFSRGSANIYGVVALDRHEKQPYFSRVIANSGGMSADFPINRDINNGQFGPKPFSGTHWVFFCGEKDPNPQRDGCPAMERTQNWVKDKGGESMLLMRDSNAGHGGFHRNADNAVKGLEALER